MELQLDPIIPMRVRSKTCKKMVFNKGYIHPIRGKTYEEYYGEEKGRAKRENQSRKMKGHRPWGNPQGASKPCLAIKGGKIIARFPSAVGAARVLGLRESTIRRYIKGKIRHPANGWQWFYEAESWKWCDILRI